MKCVIANNKNRIIAFFLTLTLIGMLLLYPYKWTVYYIKNITYGFTNIDETEIEKISEYKFSVEDEEIMPIISLLKSLEYNNEIAKNDESYTVKIKKNIFKDSFLISFDTVYLGKKKATMTSTQQLNFYDSLDELIKMKGISSRWQ